MIQSTNIQISQKNIPDHRITLENRMESTSLIHEGFIGSYAVLVEGGKPQNDLTLT